MKNKFISKAEFVAKIPNGSSIMIGGFMNIGTAEEIIDELIKTDIQDLTIICNDAGLPGIGVGKLINSGKVKKLIASHIGLNPVAGEKMTDGTMEVELIPQGTLAERIRAGGAGLGGFLTPTGIGTIVQDGKPVMEVDGKKYIVEKPLKADFAFVLGHIVDKKGNIVYNKTIRNFNPLMATAANCVVVQARNIVDIGEINPEHIITPHIFVDYIIEGGK
jgi:acetate CoA/acetoacetate CoA-transferase alpha subunit